MFLDGRRLWRSSTALENFSGLTGTLSGRWCQRTPAGLSALHLRRSLFWCSLLAADLEAVQHVSLLVGQNSSVLALVLTGLRLQLQSWACEIQHYLENHVKMNSTFETMTKDGTFIFWNVENTDSLLLLLLDVSSVPVLGKSCRPGGSECCRRCMWKSFSLCTDFCTRSLKMLVK